MAKALKTLIVFLAMSAFMLSTAYAAVPFTIGTVPYTHDVAAFTADVVVQCQGLKKPLRGRLFVKGVKVREETFGPYGTQVLIFRPDLRVTWMITRGGKMCLQMLYSPSDNKFAKWTPKQTTQALFLGNQTVSGIPCRKYQRVENGQKTVYWISRQFSFPVKVASQYETTECKNLKQCKLSDSLFEIPAGCGKPITRIAPAKE